MRLIDADLYTEVMKEYFHSKIDAGEHKVDVVDCNADLQTLLFLQQTVDAVEVVRCRDCKHKNFEYSDGLMVYCDKYNKPKYMNAFCGLGAKMDGDKK